MSSAGSSDRPHKKTSARPSRQAASVRLFAQPTRKKDRRPTCGKQASGGGTVYSVNHTPSKLLAILEQERAQGLNPGDQDPTFAEHLANWLEISVKPNVRPSTYEDRAWMVERYMKPDIGPIWLKKLTTPTIQRRLNAMIEAGFARSTVLMARRRIITALNDAEAWKATHSSA